MNNASIVYNTGSFLWKRKKYPSAASQYERAFTRAELLVILAVLALLALVVLPALANNRPRSARVICANNLRQISMGFQLWGNDRGDQPPWEVPVAQGGTMIHPLAPNTWLHFAWVSNELSTPKILLCPSDSGQPARDFTGSPDGGYLHPNFANRATSYLLSHGNTTRVSPADIFLADRNMGFDSSGGCARFSTVRIVNSRPPSPNYGWDTNLHRSSGNIIRLDGRVDQVSNTALREAALAQLPTDGASSFHMVAPR